MAVGSRPTAHALHSGASLFIGTLALARFPNEDRLSTADDGTLRATPESGPAQLGAPRGPGRGPLSIPLPLR